MKGLLIGLSYPVVFLGGGLFVHFYLAKVIAEKDRVISVLDSKADAYGQHLKSVLEAFVGKIKL